GLGEDTPMSACRRWATAAALSLLCAGNAAAQQQPAHDPWQNAQPIQQMPYQQSPTQQAPAQQSPWGQPQQMPACVKEFIALRDEIEKRGKAVQGGQKRKANVKEACGLLTALLHAQQNVYQSAKTKGPSCGLPPQVKDQIADAIKQVTPARNKVCEIASQ